MKLDQADIIFSKYIRLRDGKCMRCGSKVSFNENGDPVSHQCSHFWGRRAESVRYDGRNAETLCGGCHLFLTANPSIHTEEKIQRLGQDEFDKLRIRAHTKVKKDRRAAMIYWREKYKELKKEREDETRV